MLVELPDYDDVLLAFAEAGMIRSPAGAHGVLCGVVCSGAVDVKAIYLEMLLEEAQHAEDLTPKSKELLEELMEFSGQQIRALDFAFQMLLPGDDDALFVRAQALREWCLGFVSSLEMAGISLLGSEEEDLVEVGEIVKEFIEMDLMDLTEDDEDESYYTELVEFLRMAVILVHTNSFAVQFAMQEMEAEETIH